MTLTVKTLLAILGATTLSLSISSCDKSGKPGTPEEPQTVPTPHKATRIVSELNESSDPEDNTTKDEYVYDEEGYTIVHNLYDKGTQAFHPIEYTKFKIGGNSMSEFYPSSSPDEDGGIRLVINYVNTKRDKIREIITHIEGGVIYMKESYEYDGDNYTILKTWEDNNDKVKTVFKTEPFNTVTETYEYIDDKDDDFRLTDVDMETFLDEDNLFSKGLRHYIGDNLTREEKSVYENIHGDSYTRKIYGDIDNPDLVTALIEFTPLREVTRTYAFKNGDNGPEIEYTFTNTKVYEYVE